MRPGIITLTVHPKETVPVYSRKGKMGGGGGVVFFGWRYKKEGDLGARYKKN